jgi:hypothetical protein
MPQLLIILLMMMLLASCAAQTAMSPTDRAIAAGYQLPTCPTMNAAHGWTPCPYQPFRPSMNLGQALTDLATIPFRLPAAMIESYPSGRVTCRTSTYKDQYRTTCD